MRVYCLAFFFLVTVGCTRVPLACRSEYLYPDYLASTQIDTPDPGRDCFYGQQILVKWRIPCWSSKDSFSLLVQLRYGDREVESLQIPIYKAGGYWMYKLVNEHYWCRGGIVSFKVTLLCNGCPLDIWKHSLWTDLIELDEAEESECFNEDGKEPDFPEEFGELGE